MRRGLIVRVVCRGVQAFVREQGLASLVGHVGPFTLLLLFVCFSLLCVRPPDLLLLNVQWAEPILVIVHVLHGKVLPRHEVEVGEELEQEASDAVTPSNEVLPAPRDRLIHWLAKKGNLD